MQVNIEELERLVDDIITPDATTEPNLIENPKEYTNFKDLRKKSVGKAKGVIKKLLSFYLTSEMINDPWTIKKVSTDITNLSNCIWQMACSQYLITTILEEIDGGSTNFQMFKTAGDLQKSNLEVLKYYKQYVQILENEYAEFSANYDTYKQRQNGTEELVKSIQSDFNSDLVYQKTTRGTKNVMNLLDNLKKTKTIPENEWEVIDEEVDNDENV
jgi:hypothetical protein